MLSLNKRVSLLKKKKRIARGGDRGGTSGRGHKGQNARSGGGVGLVFEGGQMPIPRRLPKRGFNNARFAENWVAINVGHLNRAFEEGAQVTEESLREKGLLKGAKKAFVKVLGAGGLEKKLVVHAHAFSKSALEEIKKHGGEVVHIAKES